MRLDRYPGGDGGRVHGGPLRNVYMRFDRLEQRANALLNRISQLLRSGVN